jgi:VWFA-related protein
VKPTLTSLSLIALCCLALVLGGGLAATKGQQSRTRRADNQSSAQEVQAKPPENQTLDVIRVDANLVSVPVIVSDRQGRYVPNLSVDHFRLFDNNAEQTIAYFDAAEEPLNIALLLDTSRSTEGVLDKIKKAAKNFLKELRPQDRAMIVSFDFAIHHLSSCFSESNRSTDKAKSSEARCAPDDPGLTADRKILERAIKRADVGRYVGTTLNDAVMQVANKDLRPIRGRKAIILLSDGQDFGSMTSAKTLLDVESESETMVYSIFYASDPGLRFPGRGRPFPGRVPERFPGVGGRGRGRVGGRNWPMLNRLPQQGPGQTQRRARQIQRNGAGEEFLKQLAEVTSGRYYRSDVTNLGETFALIAEELRHQYQLGFYPGEITRDGSLHQLRVKVDADGVAVKPRQQYRAQ